MTLRSIAIYGQTGSGKSEIARYLASAHSYVWAKPGQICRTITRLLFDSEAKTLLNQVNDALKTIDPLLFTKASLSKISPDVLVVFDGMRVTAEYELFHSRGYRLWKVTAPRSLRIERLLARGQEFNVEVDSIHPEEEGLAAMAFDAEIINAGDLPTLWRSIDRALLG